MIILLPPSESKSQPQTGPRLDLTGLVAAELTASRRSVLDALIRMCAGDPREALQGLTLSDRQIGEVHRNAALKRAACSPAADIYTGVLYDALSLATLPAAARRRANQRILIASALFGMLRPDDLIPAYRLSGASRVTGLETLTRIWKAPLGAAIAHQSGDGVVLDLRSGDYASLAPVPASIAVRTVIGKVVDSSTGRKIAVSHFNKATKGFLARELMCSAKATRTPDALASLCAAMGFTVNLIEPARPTLPWILEVEQQHN